MDAVREVLVETTRTSLDAQARTKWPIATRSRLDTEFVGEHSYHPELWPHPDRDAETPALPRRPRSPSRTSSRFGTSSAIRPEPSSSTRAGNSPLPSRLRPVARQARRSADRGRSRLSLSARPRPLILQRPWSAIKGETLTEWRTRPLAPAQIRYAFDDVRYLLPVWEKLERRLTELGRHEWATEEFRRLRDQATPETPSDDSIGERWRNSVGSRSLDRRQRR